MRKSHIANVELTVPNAFEILSPTSPNNRDVGEHDEVKDGDDGGKRKLHDWWSKFVARWLSIVAHCDHLGNFAGRNASLLWLAGAFHAPLRTASFANLMRRMSRNYGNHVYTYGNITPGDIIVTVGAHASTETAAQALDTFLG